MLLTVRAKRQWEPTLCLRKVKQIIFCLWFISSVSDSYLLSPILIFCLRFLSSVSDSYLLSLVYIFCLRFLSSVYLLSLGCLWFVISVSGFYVLLSLLLCRTMEFELSSTKDTFVTGTRFGVLSPRRPLTNQRKRMWQMDWKRRYMRSGLRR